MDTEVGRTRGHRATVTCQGRARRGRAGGARGVTAVLMLRGRRMPAEIVVLATLGKIWQ